MTGYLGFALKLAWTTSSPMAYWVAMSRSSRIMHGVSQLSAWTSASQVVPQMKALMTSASVMLGSSLCFLEKCWMYSLRVSSGLYLQL